MSRKSRAIYLKILNNMDKEKEKKVKTVKIKKKKLIKAGC